MFPGKPTPAIRFGQFLQFTVTLALAAPLAFAQARRPSPSSSATPLTAAQSSTDDRRDGEGWWPTKGAAPLTEYTGPPACAQCHAEKSATQKTTPMANGGREAALSPILRAHDAMQIKLGPYSYAIKRDPEGSLYSASDGSHTTSERLGWAFGEGEVGESYIFERKGRFFEARISYYTRTDGLDFSPGRGISPVASLEQASGILMDATEVQRCFGCHTTASTTNNRFDPHRLIPGVTCEACHGPGVKHVNAMKAGKFGEGLKSIFNPAHLSPLDSVDFCGACHRSWWDATLSDTFGIANLRFQPYRLENSPCWLRSQGRLTCLTCHDPHQPLEKNSAAYDATCLNCHADKPSLKPASTANQHLSSEHLPQARACPVATKDCASCHMPKYEVPGMHFQFTDHDIRVVRAGAPYPP